MNGRGNFDIFTKYLRTRNSGKKEREKEQEKKKDKPQKCPECQSTNIEKDYLDGYVTCKDCTAIIDDIIDDAPEWKNYNDGTQQETARCAKSIDPLLPQTTTGIKINAYGAVGRINSWRIMPYKEKALNKAFKKILSVCNKNNIPKKIYHDARILYKTIKEQKHVHGKKKGKARITRGDKLRGLVAASLFFACRRAKMPRSVKEISIMFDIKEKVVREEKKTFHKIIKDNKLDIDLGTSQSIDFIQRKCDELHMRMVHTEKVKYITKNVDKLNIASNHTSYSVAAACIMLATKIYDLKYITKKKIASTFMLSPVTIKKAYNKVESYQNVVIDNQKIDNFIKIVNRSQNRKIISKKLSKRFKKFKIDTSLYIIVNSKKPFSEMEIHKMVMSKIESELENAEIGSSEYIKCLEELIDESEIYDLYVKNHNKKILKILEVKSRPKIKVKKKRKNKKKTKKRNKRVFRKRK